MADVFDDPDEVDGEASSAQITALRHELERSHGSACVVCSRTICGHEVLFSVVIGLKDAPRCLTCLAGGMGRTVAEFRDQLAEHVQRRDCYRRAWEMACRMEQEHPTRRPRCLWSAVSADVPAPARADEPDTSIAPSSVTDAWDAGSMSCGDLVLALCVRLRELPPGAILGVTARDPAAPEDLPAWCRLTGNQLVRSDHPLYLIQRKEH